MGFVLTLQGEHKGAIPVFPASSHSLQINVLAKLHRVRGQSAQVLAIVGYIVKIVI